MPLSRILVVLLLITLIGLILFNNKKEINQRAALAELKVDRWPVRVIEVTASSQAEARTYHGVLQPTRSLQLRSQAQGEVIKVYKNQGDRVKRGEPILKIDDDLLQTELAITEASLQQSKADWQRMKNLSTGDAVTGQQLEQAELKVKADEAKHQSLKKRIAQTTLIAPFSGHLKRMMIVEGAVVNFGMPVGEMVDQSSLKLTVLLTENEISSVTSGMAVSVVPDLYPDREVEAQVSQVAVSADPSLKFPVEIELRNQANHKLSAGMFATAKLNGPADNGIWIPRESILGDLLAPYVFVLNDKEATQTQVTIGASSSGSIQIVEGLKVGDQLVVSGQRNLTNGAKVKVIQQE